METILEQQRRYHEEKERLMDAKTKEMLHKKSTVSDSFCVSFADHQRYTDVPQRKELYGDQLVLICLVSSVDSCGNRSTLTIVQGRCWT